MHKINQSVLYKLKSHKKLFQILDTTSQEIKFIKKNKNYYTFTQKIKNKERDLIAPKDKLKAVLKNIDKYLKRISTPNYLISNKKGFSAVSNADIHKNSSFMLTLDIKNFYPSVKKEHIFRLFKYRFKQEDDIAWTLTNLVTLNDVKGVPQGFPTSSRIAFWAYYDMFEKINSLVLSNNLIMTVYVDDITISGDTKITKKLYSQIEKIILSYGFEVKRSKTKLFDVNKAKHVTGVVIYNRYLSMPYEKFAKLRGLTEKLKIEGLLNYNRFISMFNR